MASPKTFKDRDRWLCAVLASDLPHAARLVAARVALHLHIESGQCNPAHATLATDCAMGERSIYRWIAFLERAGWIEIQRTRGRHSNQYTLLNPANLVTGFNPANEVTGFSPANPVSGDNSTLPNDASNLAATVADRTTEQRREQREGQGPLKGPPAPLERDAPSSRADSSQGDGRDANAPAAASESQAARQPVKPAKEAKQASEPVSEESPAAPPLLNGEILPPVGGNAANTLDVLLAIWNRGHPADRTAYAQQRTRTEWQEACNTADPATIIAGARKWVAAADAPRFLPKLSNWLDVCGWQEAPPAKPPRQQRAGKRSGSRREGKSLAQLIAEEGKED